MFTAMEKNRIANKLVPTQIGKRKLIQHKSNILLRTIYGDPIKIVYAKTAAGITKSTENMVDVGANPVIHIKTLHMERNGVMHIKCQRLALLKHNVSVQCGKNSWCHHESSYM